MIIIHNSSPDYLAIFDTIFSALTLIFVGIGLVSIIFQKKEIQFTTIQKCIEIHRTILRSQQELEISGLKGSKLYGKRRILIRDHLGLVTEELFYMKKGYLPKQISKNWLKHMIEFIPLKCKEYVANEKAITNSKEINPFDYNEYKTLANDKKSFTQINEVFQINEKLCDLYKSKKLTKQLDNKKDDEQSNDKNKIHYIFFKNDESYNKCVDQKIVNYLFLKAKNRRFAIWFCDKFGCIFNWILFFQYYSN